MVNYASIGKKWVHPKTGEVRYYVNSAWKYGGLELDFYKTGNISSAVLDGEGISNSQGRRLMHSIDKCWIAEGTEEVHVIGDYDGYGDFIEAVKEGVRQEIAHIRDE